MLGFLGRRVVTLLFTLLAASVVVFTVLEVLPGDPALLMLGTEAREDTLAALRSQMGLDKPAPVRYLDWAGGALTGDFGTSYTYKMPVATLVGDRLAVTAPLALLALLLSTALAIPLGMLAAVKHNRVGDWGVMGFSQLGLAVPSFWVGIMLILLLSLKAKAFPTAGFGDGVPNHIKSIILPGLTVALALVPILIRSLRASLLEVLESEYVTTARSKGLSESRVLVRHALRNAAVSTVSVLGVNIGYLVGGTLVIEQVFAIPGVGQLMINSIFQRDFPVVQGVTLVFGVLVVLVNLLTDVGYSLLDPRVRFSR